MAKKNIFFKLANGNSIPALGFGTYSAAPGDRVTVGNMVKNAIKTGYRHIDCAPIYKNENEVGNAVKDSIHSGIVKRDDLFITSKLANDGHKREDVRPALLKSLKDLQLDYLDLFLIHWPVSNERGGEYPTRNTPLNYVPLSETWSEMEKLVKDKLVRSIGISNFNVSITRDLLSYAKVKPQVNQVELHPLLAQPNLVKFCQDNNVLVSAYCPLGGQRGGSTSVLDLPLIKELAVKYNKSVAQILLRWSVQLGLVPLPKSSKAERMEENFNIFDFELSAEEVKQISNLNDNRRFNNPATWPNYDPIFD